MDAFESATSSNYMIPETNSKPGPPLNKSQSISGTRKHMNTLLRLSMVAGNVDLKGF